MARWTSTPHWGRPRTRRGAGERPFFLFVSFPDPHHPFTPPAEYAARFDPAGRLVVAGLVRDGFLEADSSSEYAGDVRIVVETPAGS